MQSCNGIVEAIGNTPLIKLERVSAATGCTILGKAEFMNPGQSVKDRAALFIIQDAVKNGHAQAGRRHRRGHRGQHRHRACAGRQCDGLSLGDRHPGNPEQGEEGHAAAMRRRAGRGAGGPLFQPQQLREALRPARRATGEDRKERRDLGQPVRQCRQPPRPCRDDRAGNLAADRRQGRRLRLRRRHRRHARRHRHRAQIIQQLRAHRARRSDGRRALQLLHDRHAQIGRLVDHRRHRPGPHHQKSRRRADRYRLSDSRRGSACRSSSTCSSTKAFASAAPPASMSPAPSASRRSSVPGIPSSPFSPTTARAINRNCSIRRFCAGKSCRCRHWLERRSQIKVPFA